MATEPYIETRDAWVEFPIFDAKARSLKKAFLGKAGGTIGRNSDNVVVIEALRDITMTPVSYTHLTLPTIYSV